MILITGGMGFIGLHTARRFVDAGEAVVTEQFKKAWDILAPHYAARGGIQTVGVRASTIWGPLYHTMMNLPSRICHAAAKGVPADFSGSRTGVPFADDESDFCYVKDCALG